MQVEACNLALTTLGKMNKYRHFMKSYINNKGKVVVVAEMVDAYLLNSCAYYKKRLELAKQNSFMSDYDVELKGRVDALHAEIKRRKLI